MTYRKSDFAWNNIGYIGSAVCMGIWQGSIWAGLATFGILVSIDHRAYRL